MASEIEAAAASVDESRLREAVGNYKQGCDTKHDVGIVVAAAEVLLSCRAADRAEREERARLIDAEWLQSLSGNWEWAASFGLVRRDGIAITDVIGDEWTCHGIKVATRGDVIDLLRIMKGGAE